MHVKEQVKEFVHDVKRKFSQKHKRDTVSTFDSYEYSSADTTSHLDDSSSSSVSLDVDTSERSRFIKFIRPRTSSTATKKERYHNVLHKVKRVGSKRYRLFSAPTIPSERMVESNHKQAVSYQGPESFKPNRDVVEEPVTLRSSEDYSDVIDISARGSTQTGSEECEVESMPPSSSSSSSREADRDSLSQSQPPFDAESQSDTSGTLVTTTSSGSDLKNSASESDSRFDSIGMYSDVNSAKSHSNPPLVSPVHVIVPMASADLPPPPLPPKSDHDDEQRSPAHPTGSPAPVYLPRLTAPSMFLPIPNTDPLSALLTKYVPAEQRPRRDVAGEYTGRDVHEMVMSNSWRALAKMARDRIVASDPEDLARILDLWSLRLSALARLRLTNQASAECTNLFAVLNAVPATSVPGTFPRSGSFTSSPSLPSSPAPTAPSPLSPSGLSGLAQLPGTPSQKSTTLPSSLTVPAPVPRQSTHELVHPFELTVFRARVHYWSGDSLAYVDALCRILARCKERAREEGRVVVLRRGPRKASKAWVGGDIEGATRSEHKSKGEDQDDDDSEDKGDDETEDEDEGEEGAEEGMDGARPQGEEEEKPDDVLAAAEANLSMWLERIARVCLILASQMIEMNDYQAAINLLAPLCIHRTAPTFLPTPTPELHSALARVYLLSGNLQKAEEHFSVAASAVADSARGADVVAMNTALLAAASGNWTHAEETLSEMIAKDPGNFTAINNLAVALLSQGRIKEGIDLFEAALKTSPSSVVVVEPFLFNLSTLYELRSTAAIDKKRGLLIEVAKWSGDGLKTSCLKMPSS